jgi:hypothetical protein
VLKKIDASSNPLIFLAVLLSMFVCLLVSCIGVTVVKGLFVVINDDLLA